MRFAGQPLKRIALSFGGHMVRGEAIVTRTGLEGGAIYALTPPLREAIAANGEAMLSIALRPDIQGPRTPARCPARQAVDLDLPAQGAQPVTGRNRSAAGGDTRQARCIVARPSSRR